MRRAGTAPRAEAPLRPTSASQQAAEAAAEEAASSLLAEEESERRAGAARVEARAARVAKRAQSRATPSLLAERALDSSRGSSGGEGESCETQPLTAASESVARPVSAPVGPGVAQRLQARYGWRCELIGSALFFDGNDVDVVIELPQSATLAHAYELVVRATGWVLAGTGAIDGQRLVSLHGDFEGFAIDAQVWRGAAKANSPAEHKTQEALRATRLLVDGLCERGRESIALLHRWADASGCKGHQLCLPPGIAWTVAGTMLWQLITDWDERSEDSRLEALLQKLVGLLRIDIGVPSIALGTLPSVTDKLGACAFPLCIWLGEANLCDRMTVKTTRAVLMLAQGALGLPAGARTDAAQYEALRTRLLPVVFTAQPRSADAVPRTLHKIMHGLDSYEMVSSALASVREDGCLRIHVEPNPAADTATYGIHPRSHTASLDAARAKLQVTRMGSSTRAWELQMHHEAPRGAAVLPWEGLPRDGAALCDWWQFDGPDGSSFFIPNAAFLLVDIQSRCDARWWA